MMANTPRKVHFVDYSMKGLVQAQDKEHNKPDIAYEFSNGRKFESTDRGETGVYRKP